MFSKLLKYELRAQGGLLSLLSGGALVVGLVGGLLMTIFTNTVMKAISSSVSDMQATFGTVLPILLAVGALFVLIAYYFAVVLILFYRFYKHHFSDEGYLTFTLPATTHQILLASIAIWYLISMVVTILSGLLIFLPLMKFTQLLGDSEISITIGDVFVSSLQGYDVGVLVTQILSTICTAAGSMVLVMLSITLGSVIVKKYKLLAGFGIYYGVNMVISVISGVLGTVAAVGDTMIFSNSTGEILPLAVAGGMYLAIAVGGYFLMHYLVDERLNLP